MSNIIEPNRNPTDSTMWQFPADLGGNTDALQQQRYAEFLAAPDPTSQAIEHGVPQSPIPEGDAYTAEACNLPECDAANITGGEVPDTTETVIAIAAQGVAAEFEAMPEAQQALLRQEHLRAANARASEYAPRIELMREGALRRADYELAA